jgi:hypothetical protein
MATERDLEQLDNYLSNKMSGEEKTLFEQRLKADPELSNEFAVQQQLIKGIQKARVAELKAMLNNVPVTPIPHGGTSLIAKFAIGTVFVGAVATGIYLFNKDNSQQETTTPVETTVDSGKEVVEDKSVITTDSQTADKSAVESKAETTTTDSKTTDKTVSKAKENKQPVIDVYDPAEDSEGTENHVGQAEAQPSTTGKAEPSISVAIDNHNKDYSFHYQYKEGKLFLYGPFESNLYEIMEFFSDDKRTIFLRYNSDYFLLKEVDQKIRPLAKITDPVLIQKLEESRN